MKCILFSIVLLIVVTGTGCTDVSYYHNKGLAYKKRGDYQKAAEYYLIAAKKGNAPSQNNLGILYENGQGVKQDYNKAIEWYQKAVEQGDSEASYNLGNLYRTGLGIEKNLQKAYELYLYAAKKDDCPLAQYNLARMYEKGEGVSRDYNKAIYWFKLSAINNNTGAFFALGEIYSKAKGVKNQSKAFEWYKKGAERGNINAMTSLAYCYSEGQGINQNNTKAFEWYKRAAVKGQINAQHSLGYCFEKGLGIQRDIIKAKIWYEKAAEQGDEDSLLNLGLLSLEENNYPAAIDYLKKADRLESNDASILLASMYKYGKGVPIDLKKAESIYKKLLDKDFAPAQNGLAYLYATENKDLKEAEILVNKAIAKEPENPYYNGTLGWVYYKQKKYDKAVTQLEKAINLFPKENTEASAVDKDHLGDAYQALGKTKEAKEQWQKALKLTNDEEQKKKIAAKLEK